MRRGELTRRSQDLVQRGLQSLTALGTRTLEFATPLTLGYVGEGDLVVPIIERNTTIPARKTLVFSTTSDNQREIEIHVVQGERPFAADNELLCKVTLDGFPPAPRGIPQIEVTFDINAEGILKVSAADNNTGRSHHITIKTSSVRSEAMIEKMRREAETYATEDRKRRELVEARVAAENAVEAAEKAMRELGDALTDNVRSLIDIKILAVRSSTRFDSLRRIQQATKQLAEATRMIETDLRGKTQTE